MSKEARRSSRAARFLVLVVLLGAAASSAEAASYRTRFFLVSAPNEQLAKAVGDAAEAARRDLAVSWLGGELPDWRDVCPIHVNLARLAGGETRFVFHNGVPGQWKMTVQGPPERILDSVIPHEVLHMVFATHFGQGLPRWADEGACTTVEHISERSKQEHLLYECLTTDRGIAFNQMFAMREYPKDMLPLYAQGYSVARFLIAVGGRLRFVEFVGEGLRTNNWTAAVQRHYRFPSLGRLQANWLEWVRSGGREEWASKYFLEPLEARADETLLASASAPNAPRTAPVAEHGGASPNDVANVVATPVAPRTLPPASEPAFQILTPGATRAATNSVGTLVPVPRDATDGALLADAAPTPRAPNPPTTFAPAVRAGTKGAGTPASLASAGGDSWYARQRDAYRAGDRNDPPATGSESTPRGANVDLAVARPQPFERAQPVLVEAERPAGSLVGTPLPGTTAPTAAAPPAATFPIVPPTRSFAAAAPVETPRREVASSPNPGYAPGSTGARRGPVSVSGGDDRTRR